MDKNTLSNYGWIVIAVLVLSVMIALATPFGKYIENGVRSTSAGLFDTSEKALNVVGMSAGSGSFEDGYTGGSVESQKNPALNPDDGTTPQKGDTYSYGNYEYCYSYKFCPDGGRWSNKCACGCKNICNGWSVRCIKNVADPGPILESINGEPVTDISYTFWLNGHLTVVPEIPNSVTDMYWTFYGCVSLTVKPNIPSSVTTQESDIFLECPQFGY